MELEQLIAALIRSDDERRRAQPHATTNVGNPHQDGVVQPLRRAAVAILVSEGLDPDIALTKRADTLRDHPSQISLPGGMLEPGETVVDAALRESQEEIGFDPASATVLGTLPSAVPTRGPVHVTAVVATWPGVQRLSAVDLAEVTSVHRVPIRELTDPANRFTAHLSFGYAGPGFIADGQFVWGMTAHVLDQLFRLAGWERDWDRDRRRAVPANVGGR